MSFIAGRIAGFWTLVLMVSALLYSTSAAKKKLPNVKAPPGLTAIEEAVGRATEMGKAIHYSPGTGSLTTAVAPQAFAAFSILGLVSRTAARMGSKVICTIRYPELLPIAQEVMRTAYMQAGRPDLYSEDMARFLSSAQFAYTAGVMGIMQREKVAANFLIGPFLAESLILAEVGASLGAIQIAGCAEMGQIPFFVAACDYTLVGEELYAAAALASGDPILMGSILSQDIVKAVCVVALILGIILKYTGTAQFDKLLRM